MKNQYTYQLFGDGEIYSSFEKAHKRLCNILRKNENDFKHYKTETKNGVKMIYHYPNGYTIYKRILL